MTGREPPLVDVDAIRSITTGATGSEDEYRTRSADESAPRSADESAPSSDDRSAARPPRPEPTVHAVVLAAGTSERFGPVNKLLAEVDGERLLCRAVRPFVEAGTDGVTVVVGHEAARVERVLAPLDVAVRRNPDYEHGQSTSVSTGVRAARRAGADGVLIGLGDMPAVAPETVDALIGAYEAGAGDAIAAAYDGTRGNPVLFDSRYFDALARVDGDVGGRDLLRSSDRAIRLDVSDPGVRYGVDRPGDRRQNSHSDCW